MPVAEAASSGGCQVSLSEYVNKVRTYLNDWEFEDRLPSTITAAATTIAVTDGTRYGTGDRLEIDDEKITVSSVATNTLTVARGRQGTTAAAHSADAKILRSTHWTDQQLEDWVNESFAAMYPHMYVRDTTTLTGSSTSYDYTLPADITDGNQVEWVEAKYGSTATRLRVRDVEIREDPPQLYIPIGMSGYTLTVQYTKPFSQLTDSSRTTLPVEAELLPVYYAAAQALLEREALRGKFDSYPVVQDERVSREGQSLQTGSYYWDMFRDLLRRVRMAPKHYQ